MRRAALALTLVAALAPSTLLAYDVNKDLKNLGPAAYDIAIILAGQETVTQTYDGYTGGPFKGRFSSVSHGPSGGNTMIHWQVFNDGTNTRIDNGQTIHVGYSTADHSSQILNMYWTDASGKQIPGSVVYNITSGWTYRSNRFTLIFRNDFQAAAAIQIRDVRVAVRSSAIELADLNRFNAELESSLQPLSPGFVLAPGEEISIEVPFGVPAGSSVIANYGVAGSGGDAESEDWVQIEAVETTIGTGGTGAGTGIGGR